MNENSMLLLPSGLGQEGSTNQPLCLTDLQVLLLNLPSNDKFDKFLLFDKSPSIGPLSLL